MIDLRTWKRNRVGFVIGIVEGMVDKHLEGGCKFDTMSLDVVGFEMVGYPSHF